MVASKYLSKVYFPHEHTGKNKFNKILSMSMRWMSTYLFFCLLPNVADRKMYFFWQCEVLSSALELVCALGIFLTVPPLPHTISIRKSLAPESIEWIIEGQEGTQNLAHTIHPALRKGKKKNALPSSLLYSNAITDPSWPDGLSCGNGS
jgi:hypothetical protein